MRSKRTKRGLRQQLNGRSRAAAGRRETAKQGGDAKKSRKAEAARPDAASLPHPQPQSPQDGLPRLEVVPKDRGLSHTELDRQISAWRGIVGYGKRALSRLLADAADRRTYYAFGHPNVQVYAAKRHGLSPRRTQEHVRVGRALFELCAIDREFEAGRLSWSKVLQLVRVATPETERAWIDVARANTCEQLEVEVKLARPNGAPRKATDRKGLPELRHRVQADLGSLEHQAFELARRKLSDERGAPLDTREVLAVMAELVLSSDEDGTVSGRTRVDASLYRIHLTQETGGETQEPTGDDSGGDSSDGAGEGASLVLDTGRTRIPIPGSACACCDGTHVLPDGRIDKKTPEWLRARVLARDGHRCRSCGTGRSLQTQGIRANDLHAHHVIYRSRSGVTKACNLVTLCTVCHELVHEDLLVLEGPDATDIRFLDAEGRPIGRGLAAGELDNLLRRVVVVDHARACDIAEPPAESADDTVAAVPFEAVPLEAVPFETAFAEVVGQEALLRRLRETSEGADALGDPFPHTLFAGPPGTGKTTLARALAAFRGTRLHATSGPLLKEPGALPELMRGFRADDILFIDEIHAVPTPVLEVLYEALTDNRISHVCGAAQDATIQVPRFTLLAATTEPGRLPGALRSRFQITEPLFFHEADQLARIAIRRASARGFRVPEALALRVARFARGTPREVVRLVGGLLRKAALTTSRTITGAQVESLREDLGLDPQGLRPEEQRYLSALGASGEPIPLGRLAELLGSDARTLTRTIEPHLFARGLVRTTSRGRTLRMRPANNWVCESRPLELVPSGAESALVSCGG